MCARGSQDVNNLEAGGLQAAQQAAASAVDEVLNEADVADGENDEDEEEQDDDEDETADAEADDDDVDEVR